MLNDIKLSGEHIKILPLEEKHIKELYEAAKQPEIWTYLPIKVNNYEEFEELMLRALKVKNKMEEMPFVISHIATNSLIGSTRFLEISRKNKRLEIGWTWYRPSFWRTMVNTECKYLLLSYCFETLKLNRVQFKTDVENKRSRSAILRLGAYEEGIIRNHMILPDGRIRHSIVYSIIKEDWINIKENFKKLLER